jgi:DNA-binding HxlR family transcriptional regulator
MNHLPTLPVERALKVISGRWKPQILHWLFEGPRRFSELERRMPAISQKVLIQQLRELRAHGLVVRTAFPDTPPRVEYAVTPLAESLRPVMRSLCAWGRRHAKQQGEMRAPIECAHAIQEPMMGSRSSTKSNFVQGS